MTFLIWVLAWFKTCLGLKINFEKGKLVSMDKVVGLYDLFAKLGCDEGALPLYHLGFPLCALTYFSFWNGLMRGPGRD